MAQQSSKFINRPEAVELRLAERGHMAFLKKSEKNLNWLSVPQAAKSLVELHQQIAGIYRRIDQISVKLVRTSNDGDRQVYEAQLQDLVEQMANLQADLYVMTEQLEQMMLYCENRVELTAAPGKIPPEEEIR